MKPTPHICAIFAPKFHKEMYDTKHIQIGDYDYALPDERIAKYPVAVRDQSKLLVYRHGEKSSHTFTELPEFLPKGSLIVFNNTKVIQARLHFSKQTGARMEIFCLEPHVPNDYQLIFDSHRQCEWLCLIGNKKKWKQDALVRTIEYHGRTIRLKAEMNGTHGTGDIIRFSWDDPDMTFAEILDAVGELPIPPYLNRDTEEKDKQTYQTVYSKHDGSVAAPTAGLHFSTRVLHALDEKDIERDEITLHLGAGTFKPVKSDTIAGHEMHSEYIFVPRTSIEKLIRHGGRCTAVGTTSVRTLESLYYIGLHLLQDPSATDLHVRQWTPYETSEEWASTPTLTALEAVLKYLDDNHLEALHTSTQIIIAPGYSYHVVERMVTNFHMPKSTLLLLVSAFIGDEWRDVYRYALDNGFRFLSYGDSSLLIP